MKLSPWFPGETSPLPDRPGIYQREVGRRLRTRNNGVVWAWWDGKLWHLYAYTKCEAADIGARKHPSPRQTDYPWRGVSTDNDPFQRHPRKDEHAPDAD